MKDVIGGVTFALFPILAASMCEGIETGNISVPLCIALAAATFILYRIGKTNP